ncbi:helix-turn-helix domain-containing protein [Microbacterium sp. P05]|uniref:helix-turn-helix domain-containing protein n=1 Tax=Microbacterium sp. P05 TaxID=3366948 RepID=UPI003746CE80
MDITTDEAAERLGVSRRRVVEMLNSGELLGRHIHRTWAVDLGSVQHKELTRGNGGRPLSVASTRTMIDVLSTGSCGDARKLRNTAMHRPVSVFASALAQAVTVDRYETRQPPLAAELMHLTGESAFDEIVSDPGERLAGLSRTVHGYRRVASMEELIDEARLVPNAEGNVYLHTFRDDVFPWKRAPRALIAVDATRSTNARVRGAGLEALEQMRNRWLGAGM